MSCKVWDSSIKLRITLSCKTFKCLAEYSHKWKSFYNRLNLELVCLFVSKELLCPVFTPTHTHTEFSKNAITEHYGYCLLLITLPRVFIFTIQKITSSVSMVLVVSELPKHTWIYLLQYRCKHLLFFVF